MLLNTNLNIFNLDKFRKKIIIVSIYINDFLFRFNSPKALTWIKNAISNEYNVKDLKKIKTIIK